MKNITLLAVEASALNILVFVFLVGLRPQLRDRPLVLAKEVTERNWDVTVRDMATAYHGAEFREQAFLMGSSFSCFLSGIVLTISVVSLIRRRKLPNL